MTTERASKFVFDDVRPLEPGDKWLGRPCPDGSPQKRATLTGHRERNERELELRVLLSSEEGDHGVCDVIVEETDAYVRVRALICYDDRAEWTPARQPVAKRLLEPDPTGAVHVLTADSAD